MTTIPAPPIHHYRRRANFAPFSDHGQILG
jgi:hypothetical protein